MKPEVEVSEKTPLIEAPRIPAMSSVPIGAGSDHKSPSYEVLQSEGLLTVEYLRENVVDLDILPANTTQGRNLRSWCCWCWCLPPLLGGPIYSATHTQVDVPPGHVQRVLDDKDNHIFAGPGMHCFGPSAENGSLSQYFWKLDGTPTPFSTGHIRHGDRNILTVPQGFVGLAWDRGQPLLFPPGMHEWSSDTLQFDKTIDLGMAAIELGPFTLLTVDDGYAAVTQNNGKQVILEGGHVHFLNHRNWKFNHFISLKIQTDNLEKIQATSADNIIMQITSTVNWRIIDVQTAALMASETMHTSASHSGSFSADISKLRKDVLKQAVASLATFIGSVNYSDSFHLAAAAQSVGLGQVGPSAGVADKDNPLFNRVQMKSAVEHANEVTGLYGVQVLSINVISADPMDKKLTTALASGAVASAEALQAETAARGNSRALRINAEAEAQSAKIRAGGEAEAEIIKAKGDAESERIRASGSKDAADMIAGSEVAVDLAKMDKTSQVMGSKAKFFFGQEPGYLSNIVLKGAV